MCHLSIYCQFQRTNLMAHFHLT
ncbi:hypothetical protein CFP56_010317 [Quercus suber]|uniref:Uncharacterized protein n=1 Tax=Quercus suber TaxID=58331 RepID=A0AAW0L1M3_QUESU